MAPFLDDDFTTIAACLLEDSFWPFRRFPDCPSVDRAPHYPCAVTFDAPYELSIPRESACLWDFVHQLTHWCLPMEGHNEHFRSFYAALMEHALGRVAARSLGRAFEEQQLTFESDWLGKPAVRHDYLHPFVSAPPCAGPEADVPALAERRFDVHAA